MKNENAIKSIAHEMVKSTYPCSLQSVFESHITSQYSAMDQYVYLLQELAQILSTIGLGVLSNIVYSKVSGEPKKIKNQIEIYENTIENLKKRLYELEYENCPIRPVPSYSEFEFDEVGKIPEEEYEECLYHNKMLQDLKEKDPEVIFAVEDALSQLNKNQYCKKQS